MWPRFRADDRPEGPTCQSALPRSTAIGMIFTRITEGPLQISKAGHRRRKRPSIHRHASRFVLIVVGKRLYTLGSTKTTNLILYGASFQKLRPCLVGIEACASSHHWSRELFRTVSDSSSRSMRTTFSVYTEVPWPYESFSRREPPLSLRGSDCEFRILSGLGK